MADVLLARASGLEGFARHVVIKRIQPELAREERFVNAFLEEARIAASLHHQNIVQVHDIGDEGGSFYFAMEYVHGEDCRKLITRLRERNELMPLQLVVSIIMATAAGLHYAHEQVNPQTGESKGIIHRDVSPANILIGYDGSVKILDFGLARAAQRSTNATQSGTLKGKSSYMSPEQCTGKPLDRRTDTFSLGIVLFELLTAQRLFKGSNEFMTMAAIVDGDIPRASSLRADVPPALDEIISRALSRSPESRYQTAESLRESLEAFAVAQELRISNKALGDYLTSLFGERQEPWLVAEVTPEPSWREVESSHSGVVQKPRNQSQMIAQFTGDGDSQDSPMALAQSLGAGEWLDDDERESTSGQLPSLRRFGQPTEPTQQAKPQVRPTPPGRPTPPPGPAARPTPAPGVNVNVRPRSGEPASTVNPNVRPRASEPPQNAQAPAKKNDEVTAVLANEPIRVGDPPAKLVDTDPALPGPQPDFTQTQKAKPKREEAGSSTLVEPPIFDPLVRNERDDDDDGLDEDEPATEIALDAPVHVPDPPKEKMPMALRRPVRQPVPMQEELPRAREVVPQPLRPAGPVNMPGSPTQSGMGAVAPPRENTPPNLPPAPMPFPPGGPPGGPSFAGVDPAQVAAGFQGPRASSDMIYTGPPAPSDVSLRGSNRVFVILVIVVVVIVGALFAIRSCDDDASSPSAAPADAEVEDEDKDEDEDTHEKSAKPDASIRTRDASVRGDSAKADSDSATSGSASESASSADAKKTTLPPKRPPPKRPKGK